MSSYRMTSEINEKALEIIESIAKLPCACPFLTPVNPDDESTRTYYKKIKEPMDLSLIRMRILLKKYQYLSDLQSDINLILKNSRTFNGPSHSITQLAEILIKNFEKMFYAIFPMPVRMWIEKVGDLTWKIQNLFVNTKMPQNIESETIIGATIMQALEQQDSVIKQTTLSGKFNKLPLLKSVKLPSNPISNHDSTSSFEISADTHFSQSNGYASSTNNSFVIPVLGSSSPSTLKTSNQNIQSNDEVIKPPFIPSPLEPIFIPFPSNDHTESQVKSNQIEQNTGTNPDDEIHLYYKKHLSDYGFSDEHQDKISSNQKSYQSGQIGSNIEEEDKNDDLFVQLDVLSLDYLHINESDYDDALSDTNSNSSVSNIGFDEVSQLQDESIQSNAPIDQKQDEFDEEQEQLIIQKPLQTKEKAIKDRKPVQRKSQENDDWKGTESKRRGRPKKLKPSSDDKDNITEKSIDKEKTKTKDKSKEKAKDKSKAKVKSKDKKENEEKPTKTTKRMPKEKKELKEMKEPKGRKYPKKISHVRKAKSDSDFHAENSPISPKDHIENSEKLATTKKKAQTKRQNRKNLSADEGIDDDFFPVTKSSKNSTSSANHKKRKTKSGPGRHKKFLYDDEDYQYGPDNDEDNDQDSSSFTEEALTDGHLIAFMEAAHQLNGPNDQKEMAAIIHKTEPQIVFSGSYPVIDITKLKTVTLIALIKYTKKKFKERGKEYPIL